MSTSRLRDGSTTSDPRLDRLIQFDPRSRNHPIRELLGPRKPRSYTWAVPPDAFDQAPFGGVCVGGGFGAELASRPVVINGITMKWAQERIYWPAQKIDPWQGGSYPGASPFYEGTSVLAGAKVLTTNGWYKGYKWAFGLNDAVVALGYSGPVVLGIWWHDNMFEPNAEGQIRPGGGKAGGHAILAYAVDVKRSRVWLRNSWGSGWGINGSCWVSWDDLGSLLEDDGECCVPVGRMKRSIYT